METQTRTSGADTATLGLGSVLVGSLPAALMTDEAPDRYTVGAVFTRRPRPDEIAEILSAQTRDTLAEAGYPTVELAISDRRLEIANTNLEELRDGLGGVLADRLSEISAGVRAREEAASVRFQEAAVGEQHRAAAVAALAESVSFRPAATPRPVSGSAPGVRSDALDDRARIDDWTDEGGHAR